MAIVGPFLRHVELKWAAVNRFFDVVPASIMISINYDQNFYLSKLWFSIHVQNKNLEIRSIFKIYLSLISNNYNLGFETETPRYIFSVYIQKCLPTVAWNVWIQKETNLGCFWFFFSCLAS